MKNNFMKTAVAAICVVAAGMGGVRAYNIANQSKADMLLAENIEALSGEEPGDVQHDTSDYAAAVSRAIAHDCPFQCKMTIVCSWSAMMSNGSVITGISQGYTNQAVSPGTNISR